MHLLVLQVVTYLSIQNSNNFMYLKHLLQFFYHMFRFQLILLIFSFFFITLSTILSISVSFFIKICICICIYNTIGNVKYNRIQIVTVQFKDNIKYHL